MTKTDLSLIFSAASLALALGIATVATIALAAFLAGLLIGQTTQGGK